jgi:hypothetical protein
MAALARRKPTTEPATDSMIQTEVSHPLAARDRGTHPKDTRSVCEVGVYEARTPSHADPDRYIDRLTADGYITRGLAKSVNRGQSIRMIHERIRAEGDDFRGLSCKPGESVIFAYASAKKAVRETELTRTMDLLPLVRTKGMELVYM